MGFVVYVGRFAMKLHDYWDDRDHWWNGFVGT